MAIPAIEALTALAGRVTVIAPRWGSELYRDLPVEVRPLGRVREGSAAVLFAPSLGAAMEVRGLSRIVGTPTDYRRWLLTDPVPEGASTAETYARLAAALGSVARGAPRYRRRAADPVVDVPAGHIGLNPMSAAGAVREWRGFSALVEGWGREVVFYAGPGEEGRLRPISGGHRALVGLSLPVFASALAQCALFITNDSGAAHFAAAVGVPTLTVFTSTTAARTGPAGGAGVEGPPLPCRPCYGKKCWLEPPPCADVSVERVRAAAEAILG